MLLKKNILSSFSKSNELKLHLGSGRRAIDGFINLDNSPAVILDRFKTLKYLLYRLNVISEEKYLHDWSKIKWCDITNGLPYRDGSVSKIYTSHFLEHLSKEEGLFVLRDCYRVLKKNAIMRIVVPDLLFHAKKYVTKTEEILMKELESTNTVFHDEFLKTILGALIFKKRKGLEHLYMYDVPTMRATLKSAGFNKISICQYKKGSDEELASLDSRPEDSIFFEVKRD